MTQQPQSTIILSRIVGPVLVISGLALSARPGVLARMMDTFATDPSAPFLWGFVALLLGVTIIVFHQHWRGAVEIAISLLGCILVLRGIVLLFVPETAVAVARTLFNAAPSALIFAGAAATMIGAWLSYAGFRTKAFV